MHLKTQETCMRELTETEIEVITGGRIIVDM